MGKEIIRFLSLVLLGVLDANLLVDAVEDVINGYGISIPEAVFLALNIILILGTIVWAWI